MSKSINKQEILNRLYAHAVAYWGIDDLENLDPVIKSLIQGLASELFTVSNELENMKVRILSSLSDTLTPAGFNSPRCSHAIMQAQPVEPVVFIGNHNTFFLEKVPAEIQKGGVNRIDFTPAGQVRLIQASILYSISERMFHKHGAGNEKQQLAFSHILSEIYNHTVWFALGVADEVRNLKSAVFYIDFPKSNSRDSYLSLLPYANWEINGQALQVESGLPVWEEEALSLFHKYDLNHQTDQLVTKYYRKRFYTITSDIDLSTLQRKNFPDELKDLYDREVYENLEKLYWFKIKLPAGIPAADLYNISLNINAFPVLNKRLYDKTARQNDAVNIIPLMSDPGEVFFSMDHVSDDYGREYEYIPHQTGAKSSTATYQVKQGGIERFDSRDSRHIIAYLTDLLRSEISAFSSYGVEYINSTIELLRQGLNRLEAKTDDRPDTKDRYYLLVNSSDKADVIFYRYWSTHCELANGLAAGRSLFPYDSSLIEKNGCLLLTHSLGGASAPDAIARLNAFKYALTSHDQIFTSEDIVNFCRYELGDKIISVTVRRGIMVSNKPKEGLVRCTNLIICPKDEFREKLTDMKDELKVLLEIRSPDTYTYQILIE